VGSFWMKHHYAGSYAAVGWSGYKIWGSGIVSREDLRPKLWPRGTHVDLDGES